MATAIFCSRAILFCCRNTRRRAAPGIRCCVWTSSRAWRCRLRCGRCEPRGYLPSVLVAPQRAQRLAVSNLPCLTSKRRSFNTSHLWKPLRHRPRCLNLSLGVVLLNGITSPILRCPSDNKALPDTTRFPWERKSIGRGNHCVAATPQYAAPDMTMTLLAGSLDRWAKRLARSAACGAATAPQAEMHPPTCRHVAGRAPATPGILLLIADNGDTHSTQGH